MINPKEVLLKQATLESTNAIQAKDEISTQGNLSRVVPKSISRGDNGRDLEASQKFDGVEPTPGLKRGYRNWRRYSRKPRASESNANPANKANVIEKREEEGKINQANNDKDVPRSQDATGRGASMTPLKEKELGVVGRGVHTTSIQRGDPEKMTSIQSTELSGFSEQSDFNAKGAASPRKSEAVLLSGNEKITPPESQPKQKNCRPRRYQKWGRRRGKNLGKWKILLLFVC